MGTHMKTTVDIADAVLEEAKATASREGTTVRALIEEGLRRVLEERAERSEFRLRRKTFAGNGLQPTVRDGSWERVRDLIYEERGG